MPRTVEIAGGGIAGLTVASVFARNGWNVRLHERAPGLREIGAGIYLKENSLRVLERLGVYGQLAADAARLVETRVMTDGGRVLIRRDVSGERVIVALREQLHGVLLKAATDAGAEIITSSRVESASGDGTITLQSGRQLARADLVVGADGVHSRIRPTAGFQARVVALRDGATRLLIPRTERELISTEHWSGSLRVGVTPCSADETYVFLISPERDLNAKQIPVDTEYWTRAFPHLRDVFERVSPDAGAHHPHTVVHCRSWARGKVAIVGDAAHAQPPNLGQGAGLAIANAWALAEAIEQSGDVEAGLRRWDREARPVGRAVQKWSCRYGSLSYRWPARLRGLRAPTLWALGNWSPTSTRWAWLWRGGLARPELGAEGCTAFPAKADE
jgi:2-polyprenyl-6-methoxyphenol hydroxylase-like FAD-dependent oxidoreductase